MYLEQPKKKTSDKCTYAKLNNKTPFERPFFSHRSTLLTLETMHGSKRINRSTAPERHTSQKQFKIITNYISQPPPSSIRYTDVERRGGNKNARNLHPRLPPGKIHVAIPFKHRNKAADSFATIQKRNAPRTMPRVYINSATTRIPRRRSPAFRAHHNRPPYSKHIAHLQ